MANKKIIVLDQKKLQALKSNQEIKKLQEHNWCYPLPQDKGEDGFFCDMSRSPFFFMGESFFLFMEDESQKETKSEEKKKLFSKFIKEKMQSHFELAAIDSNYEKLCDSQDQLLYGFLKNIVYHSTGYHFCSDFVVNINYYPDGKPYVDILHYNINIRLMDVSNMGNNVVCELPGTVSVRFDFIPGENTSKYDAKFNCIIPSNSLLAGLCSENESQPQKMFSYFAKGNKKQTTKKDLIDKLVSEASTVKIREDDFLEEFQGFKLIIEQLLNDIEKILQDKKLLADLNQVFKKNKSETGSVKLLLKSILTLIVQLLKNPANDIALLALGRCQRSISELLKPEDNILYGLLIFSKHCEDLKGSILDENKYKEQIGKIKKALSEKSRFLDHKELDFIMREIDDMKKCGITDIKTINDILQSVLEIIAVKKISENDLKRFARIENSINGDLFNAASDIKNQFDDVKQKISDLRGNTLHSKKNIK